MTFTIATLFEDKTHGWGLRGDPLLWQDMKLHFASTPVPETAHELEEMVHAAFKTLTGKDITNTEIIALKKYSVGHGLSDGCISPVWWLEKGLPYLIAQYEKRMTHWEEPPELEIDEETELKHKAWAALESIEDYSFTIEEALETYELTREELEQHRASWNKLK